MHAERGDGLLYATKVKQLKGQILVHFNMNVKGAMKLKCWYGWKISLKRYLHGLGGLYTHRHGLQKALLSMWFV